VRSANLTFRVLTPPDQGALEIFLERHWSSSVTLIAYSRSGGLFDQGYPFQGTYVAAWDGATIVALAVHYSNNVMVVQAPQSLTPIVRMAASESRRPVMAVQGPWPQVEAAVGALGIAPRNKFVGKPQSLSTLDMGKLQVPEVMGRGEVTARKATMDDIPTLVSWISEMHVQSNGATDSPELRDYVEQELQQQVQASGLFVAETDHIVATACYEIWSPPTVKIGSVYAPPEYKDKGYAACAVYAALELARSHGVQRAAILCDRNNMALQRSYRAMGFMAPNDYGVLRYAG